jgi:hypothetical protein
MAAKVSYTVLLLLLYIMHKHTTQWELHVLSEAA